MSAWVYLLLFISVFVSDGIYNAWMRAANTNRRLVASLAAALLPIAGLFQVVCLIEGTWTERVLIGLVDAAASFLATWLVMTYFPSADAQG